MQVTTYTASPDMRTDQFGYKDVLAAAVDINKTLGDSGEASFLAADGIMADRSAECAMQRELDACTPFIRNNLMVQKCTVETSDD